MRNEALTAGARRAWQLAQAVARFAAAAAVEPGHLLWALVLDESRASAALAERGLTVEQLTVLWPLPTPLDSQQLDILVATTATPLPEQPLLLQVFDQARGAVIPTGQSAEVGTEHLLAGLVLVDSPIALILERFGYNKADPETGFQPGGEAHAPLPADALPVISRATVADDTDTWRMIDSAANRAREGLRVVEDYVRFGLDDAHLTRLLKEYRHELSQLLSTGESRRQLAARDTRADVGTTIHTRHEATRDHLGDVVRANFKRVQEATRTLEECWKVVHPESAPLLEQLRYRLYTLEKAVFATEANLCTLAARPLYVLVTEELCHHGSGPAILGALQGGAGIIQIREKRMPDRQLLEHARRVREWTRNADVLLILNDRPDLAVLADADGVHIGQDELRVRDARRIVGPDRLVGVSTHTLEQARQAVLEGADYIGVGPVFPSQTKAFSEFAGLELVRQVAAEIRLPAFAIGGISGDNLSEVIAAGSRRIAVSAAICSQPDAELATRALRAYLPG